MTTINIRHNGVGAKWKAVCSPLCGLIHKGVCSAGWNGLDDMGYPAPGIHCPGPGKYELHKVEENQ